jgi:uncharacterized protein
MRHWLAALIAFCVLAIGIAGAAAETRVALVIGNSAYRHAERLPNPVNDATAIAELFRQASFDDVRLVTDVSVSEMRSELREFSVKAAQADIAVVYYAGHGIEMGGHNFLIPVDATLARDIDTEDETVDLDRVLQLLESVKRLKLVILDACRSNPFAEKMQRTITARAIGRGLGQPQVQTSNTLVAFAAKAGSTALDGQSNHSPFTAALLHHIATPGLDLRIALGDVHDDVQSASNGEQEPFLYGAMGGGVVALVPANTQAKDPQAAPPPVVARPEESSEVRECDLLAASPFDPTRPTSTPGVAPEKIDAPRAIEACRKALAERPSDVRLKYQLGRAFEAAKQWALALPLYREAADAGSTLAVNNLARLYGQGLGVAKNLVEEIRLLRKAADAGNAFAMMNLAGKYATGSGVPKDELESVRLLRKAVAAGLVEAMVRLGLQYEEGKGVAKNEAEAVRLYRAAAEAGHVRAAEFLGRMYANGRGVTRDIGTARKWYEKAAALGDKEAKRNLANLR